jgi:hypothetical protein
MGLLLGPLLELVAEVQQLHILSAHMLAHVQGEGVMAWEWVPLNIDLRLASIIHGSGICNDLSIRTALRGRQEWVAHCAWLL